MKDENPISSLPGANDLLDRLADSLSDGRFAGMLLFDVDHMHGINLSKGYETGDAIIGIVAEFITGIGEQIHRVGGDEFAIVVEDSTTLDRFDGVRQEISAAIRERLDIHTTVSAGGIRCTTGDFQFGRESTRLLYSTIHSLLHEAKRQGRDRLIWLPEDSEDPPELLRIGLDFYRELARTVSATARKMEVESRTDVLTGLYNRRGFEDTFQRSIQSAQRSNSPLALIYMDSDTLKTINDSKGHDGGDRFIVDIARVLRSVVRGTDFLSRWAGDEFAVIMDDTSKDQAMALAGRIHVAIADRTEGTMSIGVYCGIPRSADEALKQADLAVYRAKRAGKNRIEFAD